MNASSNDSEIWVCKDSGCEKLHLKGKKMKPTRKEIECIETAWVYKKKAQKLIYEKSWIYFFANAFRRISIRKRMVDKEKMEAPLDLDMCEVSVDKTFFQLWSDHGLRDFGVIHMMNYEYTSEDKIECIEKWCKILYPMKIDFKMMEKEIITRHSNERMELQKKDFIWVTYNPPEDYLPEAIDRKIGNYLP